MKKNETASAKKDSSSRDKSSGGAQSRREDNGKSATGTPHPKQGKRTDRELQDRKGVK